jgi:molybdopterin synthase catalytic subunit/molybdopterin converting factor small subunit
VTKLDASSSTVAPATATSLRLRVRLFAAFRERAGAPEVEVEVDDGATMRDVVAAVVARAPALGDVVHTARPVRNREFVSPDAPVAASDEVALLPPVSGGSEGGRRFWLTERPLDAAEVSRVVEDPACGAVVTFVGAVRRENEGREVDYLEYEAYPGMAEEKMAEIAGEIEARWGITRVAMAHRLGRCDVGEPSIVIAVASGHRREAFEACHYAIDRVKEIVPIWKREVWRDGAVWIGMKA